MTKVLLMILMFNIMTFSMGQLIQLRPSDFRRLSRMGSEYTPRDDKPVEPTCEELKAMWRFSRRQARASEITNEVPVFKDPFAYNIWQKYPKTRNSPTALSATRPTGRIRSKPVYGRVVNSAPSDHPRVATTEPPKYYGVVRYFEPTEEEQSRRNFGLAGTFGPPNRKQKGSFQRLKELVLAERMKEAEEERKKIQSLPAVNRSSAPAPAQSSASRSVSGTGLSPASPPTRIPASTPTPDGALASMKDTPISRPYESEFQGQESSSSVSGPYISAFQGPEASVPESGPYNSPSQGEETSKPVSRPYIFPFQGQKTSKPASRPYIFPFQGQKTSKPASRPYIFPFKGQKTSKPASRPYTSPFQGEESSDNIDPYNLNRSTRMKIITDYFNRRSHENAGDYEDDEDDEFLNRDPAYGTPYRLNQVFMDDPPNYDY